MYCRRRCAGGCGGGRCSAHASSAEKAGLTPGDVIVQMGDKKITSVADFENHSCDVYWRSLDIVLVRQGEQQTLTLEIFADTQEQCGTGSE